jgi:hypothetical protein
MSRRRLERFKLVPFASYRITCFFTSFCFPSTDSSNDTAAIITTRKER